MFYDLFKQLAEERGISVHKAATDIGLSKSTATKWKRTAATPQGETLQKIADYFGVSVDYLLTGEKYGNPAISSSEKNKVPPAKAEGEKAELLNLIDALSEEEAKKLFEYAGLLLKAREAGQ